MLKSCFLLTCQEDRRYIGHIKITGHIKMQDIGKRKSNRNSISTDAFGNCAVRVVRIVHGSAFSQGLGSYGYRYLHR